MFRSALAAFAIAAATLLPASLSATTLDNGSGTLGSVSSFGYPDSQTYGQVFTAPVTGTLTSFTLWLDGAVANIVGGVGTWNGTAAFDYGFGSDTTLFNSASTPSVAGANTFTTNISVTAGNLYVAFLSVFGLDDIYATTSMPLSDTVTPGIEYFVWNNGTNPNGNSSWNYFFNAGSVRFAATFEPSSVPLPASLPLALLALAGLGFVARRRNTSGAAV